MLTQKEELILISLSRSPKSGAEIKSAILDCTEIDLLPASLYPTLQKLLDRGFIKIYLSTKKSIIYEITKEGYSMLERQFKNRKQLQTF